MASAATSAVAVAAAAAAAARGIILIEPVCTTTGPFRPGSAEPVWRPVNGTA